MCSCSPKFTQIFEAFYSGDLIIEKVYDYSPSDNDEKAVVRYWLNELRREKFCLKVLRPGPTQLGCTATEDG